MKRKLLSLIALALLLPATAPGQNVSDLIVSEALARPDGEGILDDFGRRGGWIEVFNTSQGTVNIGGCFLTDDLSDLRKSMIPKGDLRTQIGPRQTALFFTSGRSLDGTFYTGFTLEPGQTVYLVSNDGRTVIDSLALPPTLPDGLSVSKTPRDLRQKVYEAESEPTVPTPGIPNGDQNAESHAQRMARLDPSGWILSLTSVSVVFSALAILWLCFWLLFERPAKRAAGQLPARKQRRAKPAGKKDPDGEVAAAIALALDMEDAGETYAAIAMALHLALSGSVHDAEPYIITLRKTAGPGWTDRKQVFRKTPAR